MLQLCSKTKCYYAIVDANVTARAYVNINVTVYSHVYITKYYVVDIYNVTV